MSEIMHEICFPALNDQLLRAIRRWQDEDPKGVSVSNSLGWHSQYQLHKREEFGGIVEAISFTLEKLGREINVVDTVRPVIDASWVNVSPKYAANRMHVHPDVYLSGVYYVQVPKNSGRLCFRDPRPQIESMIFPVKRDTMWSEVSYEPRPGRMFIFPAWLPP